MDLTIDDPALRKAQGIRCRNLNANDRCDIYPVRPNTCRTFYCGWRRLDWVSETLRPDTSGVLVGLQYTDKARRDQVASFTLLSRIALKADGLAESVAAAVEAGLPVEVIVPGPPGHTSGWARIDDAVRDDVARKDMAGVRRVLRQAWRLLVSGDHQPIVFGGNDH